MMAKQLYKENNLICPEEWKKFRHWFSISLEEVLTVIRDAEGPAPVKETVARVAAIFVTGSSLQFAAYFCSMGERIVLCIVGPVIPGDGGWL